MKIMLSLTSASMSQLFDFGKRYVTVYFFGVAGMKIYDDIYRAILSRFMPPNYGEINMVKFVKNTNKLCKSHIYANITCTETKKVDEVFECSTSVLKWMVDFYDSCNETLDIAIYLVTCTEFREAILRAKKRGVVVRLVTDFTMAKGSGSAIPMFIKQGIPVRMHDSKHMMHRKSALVDRKVILMGSGNWTMQALAGNWDGWIMTSDPTIVGGYVGTFEHQWSDRELFEPTLTEFEALRLHV